MGAFGSISLGTKFSIILCCLVALSFGAGLVKLWINKRRLRRNTKLEEEQSAGRSRDTEKLVGRKLEEGELFGVRAIQSGYFGGVAQSRSSSPILSRSQSPITQLPLRDEYGKSYVQYGVADLPQAPSATTIPIPTNPPPVKKKPAPLQLYPSDAQYTGRRIRGQIDPNSDSRETLTPASSPNPEVYTPTSGVSPVSELPPTIIDSEPASQDNQRRPKSYLPKLGFTTEVDGNGTLTSSLLGTIRRKKPEFTSVARDDAPISAPVERAGDQSPAYSVFPPPPIPSRAARRSERSIFPRSDDVERPTSRRSGKSINLGDIPIPPIPVTYEPSSSATPSSDISDHHGTSARTYSVSGNPHPRSRSVSRGTSEASRNRADSSAYSAANFVSSYAPDEMASAQQHMRTRSRSVSSQREREGRSRNASHSHRRQSSSKSLSRTRDSVKEHRRKQSEDQSAMKGRSRRQEEVLDDSALQQRDRSASTQGRTSDMPESTAPNPRHKSQPPQSKIPRPNIDKPGMGTFDTGKIPTSKFRRLSVRKTSRNSLGNPGGASSLSYAQINEHPQDSAYTQNDNRTTNPAKRASSRSLRQDPFASDESIRPSATSRRPPPPPPARGSAGAGAGSFTAGDVILETPTPVAREKFRSRVKSG